MPRVPGSIVLGHANVTAPAYGEWRNGCWEQRMSRESFAVAVAEFGSGAGIDDVVEMLRRGLIEVDGIPVEVTYSQALDACRIELDLGEPPAGSGDNFLRFLLGLNVDADAT